MVRTLTKLQKQEIEQAYALWCVEPNHSATKVAEKMGKNPRTVRWWVTKYDFRGRYIRDNEEMMAKRRAYSEVLITEVLEDAIARAAAIVRNPKSHDRDAVNALRVIAEYAIGKSITVNQKVDARVITGTVQDLMKKIEAIPAGDAQKMLTEVTEANMVAHEEEKR